FTPQAHGARVMRPDGTPSPKGVRMILPNIDNLPAGTVVSLWSYDAHRSWFSYGQGTVSANGRQIIPDPGVEVHGLPRCFPPGNQNAAPSVNPTLDGARDGDPVDLATGLFVYEKVDLVVEDVIPIVFKRQYRQGGVGNILGLRTNTPYQMYL